jgi:hypothetical protein
MVSLDNGGLFLRDRKTSTAKKQVCRILKSPYSSKMPGRRLFELACHCPGPGVQRNVVTILVLNQLDLTEGFNAKIY